MWLVTCVTGFTGLSLLARGAEPWQQQAASAVILAHNHPSGIVKPSRADEALTNTLKQTLALVDVRVLDHVIVGSLRSLSMSEQGLI